MFTAKKVAVVQAAVVPVSCVLLILVPFSHCLQKYVAAVFCSSEGMHTMSRPLSNFVLGLTHKIQHCSWLDS